MQPSDFSLHGAVDLGARRAAAERRTAGGGSPNVIEVTEETFNTEVVERSRSVPVVIDFWATWCQPCKQLSPILEKLAQEAGGRWILAKVDVDANQQLAAAMRVQSLPTVIAVFAGQAVHGFMGALPESQVRQWLDQLLTAVERAQAEGQPPEVGEATEVPEEPADPELVEANDAINRGDLDAAAVAFQKILSRAPADEAAKVGLAQVELMRRGRDVDADAARREAAANPNDVEAQCRVADIDMLAGRMEEAFDRLVGTVRRTKGEDRERARIHLLTLFDVMPAGDPRVKRARAALTSALY
ncbi:MAG: thioredoxin [Streptosporangiales bacterium]|nr:thioredoxin [Streptosporangiales bacterium]